MKRVRSEDMTIDQLVGRFAEIAVAQEQALDRFEYRKFNRLYGDMDAIDNELRARGPKARLALLSLYNHPNMQVRVKAAKRTLGVAPDQARRALQAISDSRCYPQAMEAGICIKNLDSGFYKPT